LQLAYPKLRVMAIFVVQPQSLVLGFQRLLFLTYYASSNLCLHW